MTDLERAHKFMQQHFDCQDVICTFAAGCGCAAEIAHLVAAARQEGVEEAWADISKIETAAYIRGRQTGLNLAALEDKYGSFDAKVQAQIAEAERRGAEEMRKRAAQQAENLWFDARDTEWDEGVNCAKRRVATAIRALPLTPEER